MRGRQYKISSLVAQRTYTGEFGDHREVEETPGCGFGSVVVLGPFGLAPNILILLLFLRQDLIL